MTAPLDGLIAPMARPWLETPGLSLRIVGMGFLVMTACGIPGVFLLLRRMALVGDALSHSLLPGIVIAFFLGGGSAGAWMFPAALAAGLASMALMETLAAHSKLKPDAAMCVVFTTFFAAGAVMLSAGERGGAVHLDTECVLFGDIALVALEPPVAWNGLLLPPASILRMAAILAAVLVLLAIFWKEAVLLTFDPGMARAAGFPVGLWHYGFLAVVAVVVVGAFEAAGAILVVGMLVVPPMFAAEMSDRLLSRLGWVAAHAAAASFIGFHLSLSLDCSPAGAMVVASSALFAAAWIIRRI
ncbi:MAG: metal ABC transporter permease [Terrimicrobiaceae bacterium]|nr:metal ABC transporter permease [Terrimicrobiaceae bacterium]